MFLHLFGIAAKLIIVSIVLALLGAHPGHAQFSGGGAGMGERMPRGDGMRGGGMHDRGMRGGGGLGVGIGIARDAMQDSERPRVRDHVRSPKPRAARRAARSSAVDEERGRVVKKKTKKKQRRAGKLGDDPPKAGGQKKDDPKKPDEEKPKKAEEPKQPASPEQPPKTPSDPPTTTDKGTPEKSTTADKPGDGGKPGGGDEPKTPPTNLSKTIDGKQVSCVFENSTVTGEKELDCAGHKGKITVRTGTVKVMQEGDAQPLDVFQDHEHSITYSGSACVDCRWLQMAWREVVVWKGETKESLEGTFTSEMVNPQTKKDTGHTYDLTTDPKSPKWTVDGPHDGGSDPTVSFERFCPVVVECTSTTTFDMPGSGLRKAIRVKDASKVKGATKLESIFHAETFLICNGKVCAKISWSATYSYDLPKAKADTPPSYGKPEIDTSGKGPNEKQIEAINREFPGQTVVK